jgi:hypothetical protein
MAAGVVMAEVAVAVAVVVVVAVAVAVTDYPMQFYHQVHIKTFIFFSRIYIPPAKAFQKVRGSSAGSSLCLLNVCMSVPDNSSLVANECLCSNVRYLSLISFLERICNLSL